MKLLLAFTPFHTPASPPFGLACLKGAVTESRPDAAVKTVDWNLAFFCRWLTGQMPHLCHLHPTHLLGTVCPTLITESGIGLTILDDLTRLPATPDEQNYLAPKPDINRPPEAKAEQAKAGRKERIYEW